MKYDETDIETVIDVAWDLVNEAVMHRNYGRDVYEVEICAVQALEYALNQLPDPDEDDDDE